MDTITASQIRAARGLLDWTRDELVVKSGVPKSTLVRVESDAVTPRRSTLMAIRAALEAAGVEFIAENGGGPGVRLKSREILDAIEAQENRDKAWERALTRVHPSEQSQTAIRKSEDKET